MNITKTIAKELTITKELPSFKAGDNISVYYTIKEGEKQRTQFFKGQVIQRKGSGATETFTIRKISHSVSVERIFPINLPTIQKIEVNNKGIVRHSKIYYFKKLTGKKAKIKEGKSNKEIGRILFIASAKILIGSSLVLFFI